MQRIPTILPKLTLTIGQMASKLGVHPQTIRRWERLGTMPKPERTLGNHRRYNTIPTNPGITIGYVRVSSHDQKSDLERQQTYVESQAGHQVHIIRDLGSGMNYRKAGFRQLLRLLLGTVKELILVNKDRLLRFGSEIIFQICSHFGVKVTILDEEPEKPAMERFCQDLVEIMTVFCSKVYGHRATNTGKDQL